MISNRNRKPVRSSRVARKLRKERAKKAIYFLFGLSFFVGSITYLFSLPWLPIEGVEVYGTEISKSSIESLVMRELSGRYAGVVPKNGGIFYPKERIIKAISEEMPGIASASVSLARKTLRVDLEDRKPVGVWCENDFCLYFDRTGFAFATSSMAVSHDLYRFENFEGGEKPAVGKTFMNQPNLGVLISTMNNIAVLGLFPETLKLETDGARTVLLRGGARILFSPAVDLSKEIARLQALLSEQNLLPKKNNYLAVDYVDLRHGNKIYFKPK